MIEVLDENKNLIGYINPSVSIPSNGEIVVINNKNYLVTCWQYYFSGDFSNSVTPLTEKIPTMFVKEIV